MHCSLLKDSLLPILWQIHVEDCAMWAEWCEHTSVTSLSLYAHLSNSVLIFHSLVTGVHGGSSVIPMRAD